MPLLLQYVHLLYFEWSPPWPIVLTFYPEEEKVAEDEGGIVPLWKSRDPHLAGGK